MGKTRECGEIHLETPTKPDKTLKKVMETQPLFKIRWGWNSKRYKKERTRVEQIRHDIARISKAIDRLADIRDDRSAIYIACWQRGDKVRPPSHMLSDYTVGKLIKQRVNLNIELKALEALGAK